MLRFASLGSGSKGNGTLVEDDATCVLIDCGFSIRETEKRLARLGRAPDDLAAILVTHEHGDHVRGVGPLARKYSLPIHLTQGTAIASRRVIDERCSTRAIVPHRPVAIGSLEITPVSVPHDAREPVQFIARAGALRVGVLTDLGSVSNNVLEHYLACDGLLLEANHDVRMLATGPYPPSLKRRVGSDWGHLNNSQAAGLLSRLESSKIQSLVMGHISEKNNHQDLVKAAVEPFARQVGRLMYACQDQGFAWQTVE